MQLHLEQLPSNSERAPVFFSPNAGSYAVIRMNPVAMVQDLNDPEALSAAEALPTRAYVVYLKNVRSFGISSFNFQTLTILA